MDCNTSIKLLKLLLEVFTKVLHLPVAGQCVKNL